jgi:adenylate cyclase
MHQMHPQRRLAEILVADVVGYSRLMGSDESGTLRRIKIIRRQVVDPSIAAYHGRVVKTTGDGILIEYPSAVEAVGSAVAVQRTMAERNAEIPAEQRIEFRVGVRQGDIVADDQDIFGDGVNVAARLEALCEPAGICISGRVYEDMSGRLELPFEDGGEQQLKNIARPVRIYALRTGAIAGLPATPALASGDPSNNGFARWLGQVLTPTLPTKSLRWLVLLPVALALAGIGAWQVTKRAQAPPRFEAANQSKGPTIAVLPLPDRPSIAVLPFANIGDDPRQDYFGDGIAENLTTSLSKFANLFVIASGSAFKYRARSVDTKAVGHELGVRYLLQGSVRRDADRLRITVELVDANNGQQLWAERYDRPPNGVFAIQDEVAQQIVSKLVAQINKQDLERAMRKPPETLAAYDYYLQGNALMRSSRGEKRGEAIAAARALYEQSAAADPLTYLAGWVDPSPGHKIGGEFQQQTVIDRALSLAQKAVELDGNLAEARATLGWILFWQHRTKDGLAEFDRAFELNPNLVDWRYSIMLTHASRAPEALAFTKRIMRLDPLFPAIYLHCLGKAYYFLGRNEEAIEQFQAVADFEQLALVLARQAPPGGRACGVWQH